MDNTDSGVYAVETKSLRHCFALGPKPSSTSKGGGLPCYRIERDGHPDVFASGVTNAPAADTQRGREQYAPGRVTFDRRFSEKLLLQDGEDVVVCSIIDPAICRAVSLEPLSADDWEILELHATLVEQQLLSQIRVVYAGLVFPFWINPSTVVYVKAVAIEPSGTCAVLDRNSEVRIAPVLRAAGDFTPAAPSQASKVSTNSSADLSSESASLPPATGDAPTDASSSSMLDSFYSWSAAKLSSLHDSMSSSQWNAASMLEGGGVWEGDASIASGTSSRAEPSSAQPTVDDRQHEVNAPGELGSLPDSANATSSQARPSKSTALYPRVFRVQPRPCGAARIPACCLEQSNTVVMTCETWKQQQQRCGRDCGHSCDTGEDERHVALLSLVQKTSSSSRWLSIVGRRPRAARLERPSCLVTVRVLCSASLLESPLQPGHLLLPDTLRRVTEAALYHPAAVKDLDSQYRQLDVKGIILTVLEPDALKCPVAGYEDDLRDAFVAHVDENTCPEHPWICGTTSLCSLTVLSQTVDVRVDCLGGSGDAHAETFYFALTAECLARIHIAVKAADQETEGDLASLAPLSAVDKSVQLCCLSDLGGVQEIAAGCLARIIPFLVPGSEALAGSQPGILVCGSVSGPSGQSSRPSEVGTVSGDSGTSPVHPVFGRTSLVQALARFAQESPAMAFVSYLSCMDWKGKRGEFIEHKLRQAVQYCIECQPAVLILDDLHAIAPSSESLSEESQHLSVLSDRYSKVLCSLHSELCRARHRVVLVATVSDTSSLHPELCKNVFCQPIVIPAPSVEERHDMLQKLLHSVEVEIGDDVDLRQVARRTDGSVVGDLKHLISRTVHFSAVRRIHDAESTLFPIRDASGLEMSSEDMLACTVMQCDVTEALSGFVPALHRGIQANRDEGVSFDDVGGLDDAKLSLKQALQLPAKYPRLFETCPIRLASGLLLYGMPGTGKTYLAKALAEECSIRMICVKGPELLNKYIGASEQAVRQVMARAQAAKPCVVFFDEFDALAPRRGHDSTGVTDRVVNQLLTQLDGVEGREGVFVLAATSRPDMIDPALLRPGRLDKSILCPLPNQSQRLAILQCLARTVSLADDVDLEALAAETASFTGADLRALVFNAQLAAVHQVQSSCQAIQGGAGVLTAQHFTSALSSTKPSLPETERRRLERIYKQFSKSKKESSSDREWPEQRATLA